MPNPTDPSKVSDEEIRALLDSIEPVWEEKSENSKDSVDEEIEFLEALSNDTVVSGMKYKNKMFKQFLDKIAVEHREAKSKPIPHVGPNPPRGRKLF